MLALDDILAVLPAPAFSLAISLHWAVLAYIVMGVATFVLYAIDKSRSRQNRWRIRESHLHACEVLFGWPGGLLAQRVLRHKNRKTSFQVVFWFIGTGHAIFWAWWFFGRG